MNPNGQSEQQKLPRAEPENDREKPGRGYSAAGVVGGEVEPGGRVALKAPRGSRPGIEEIASERVAGYVDRRAGRKKRRLRELAKKLNSKTTKNTAAATSNSA